MALRYQLKTFLLMVISAAIVVGVTSTIAVKQVNVRQSISALAAEDDGNVWIFTDSGQQFSETNQLPPSKIYLTGLDPDGVFRNLRLVQRVVSIEAIDLSGSMLAPSKLGSLRPNVSVHKLTLNFCLGLSQDVCELLVRAFPNLRELELVESDIDVHGLKAFSRASQISKLDASRLSIPIGSLVRACTAFQHLDHLAIRGTVINGELPILCTIEGLKVLDVSLGEFTTLDLESFLKCAGSLRLIVIACDIEEEVIGRFEKRFPNVRIETR